MKPSGHCAYCKRKMVPDTATHPTRDHVIPRSKGGKQTVPCCFKCNNAKGDMLPNEWARFMREFPEWWKTPGREAQGRREILATRRRIRESLSKANLIVPLSVPKEYDDQMAQAAFEAVYRNRLHLLRVEAPDPN